MESEAGPEDQGKLDPPNTDHPKHLQNISSRVQLCWPANDLPIINPQSKKLTSNKNNIYFFFETTFKILSLKK